MVKCGTNLGLHSCRCSRLPQRSAPAVLIASLLGLFNASIATNAIAQISPGPGLRAERLRELSLEELSEIKITSVSRRVERLADAAASVFVITNDELRRSGVTSLPEALRLAPNLHVAQVNANSYAISARGLNGSNNSAPNKLLVLIDGRSVYSPLFSGVFWDVQDMMLEDVERIEVISGPGGTLWGINAVNGVINIITRTAKNTQGNLVSAGIGNSESNVAFRHGGTLGADAHYRVYGRYVDRKHTFTESGTPVSDALHKAQAGFRLDWAHSGDEIAVHGNVYDGMQGQPAPGAVAISGVNLALGDVPVSGVNLLARWSRLLDGGSSLNLQTYYDRTKRSVPPTFSETLDIVDIQLHHLLRPIGMHTWTWGANYRYSKDHIGNSSYFAFLPAKVNQRWSSLFAQDEMALTEDVRLTLGARIERNIYTGNEFLPNARLAWQVAPDHLLWTAMSRTVRAPSRLDRDAYLPGTPPFLLAGGPQTISEVAKVFEIGYRGRLTRDLSYSVTAFHNIYDDLRTQELTPIRTQVVFANRMEGKASGIETWGSYQATPNWRLSAGYTALKEELRLKSGSTDVAALNITGFNPAHTWMLRSSSDLSRQSELDITLRHVSKLENPAVPAYTTLGMRYGWKPREDLEVSLAVQNLLGSHAEYANPSTRSELERRVNLQVVSHF